MLTATDTENVVTFWRDASYGELDLSGSQSFGWLTLAHKQQDFQDALASLGNTKARSTMVDWAKQAASDAQIDLAPFYGVCVYMSTPTDLWGSKGTVVCDVASSLSQILQEYGHGYGLEHSRSVADPTDYANPFCVMSGMTFGGTDPTFAGRFGASGPLLCSPYVDAAGWFAASQIARIETNGTHPAWSSFRLSPLGGTAQPYPQAVIFNLNEPFEVTYFIEYRSGGWDRGLTQTQVVIHQRRSDGYAYYAGNVPASVGFANGVTLLPGRSWRDPQFDLSVRLSAVFDQGDAVEISVGPAAAVQPLSVRTIARDKLNLTDRLSIRSQILQPATNSLHTSLMALLSR